MMTAAHGRALAGSAAACTAGRELVLGAVQLRGYVGSSLIHMRSLVSRHVSSDADQWYTLAVG